MSKPTIFVSTSQSLIRKGGVYQIINTVNGKRYIGSAVCFYSRWLNHQSDLRRRKHGSKLLQAAWDKHGSAAFTFEILLVCAPEDLVFFEQLGIDSYRATNRQYGYNVASAGNRLGCKHSEQTKQKISLAKKGRSLSLEHREKIADAKRGKQTSSETRHKLRIAKLGKKLGPQSAEMRLQKSLKQKGNKPWNTGKTMTDAQKASRHGRKPWNTGKKLPPSLVEQMSRVAKAAYTEEHRRAQSKARARFSPEEAAEIKALHKGGLSYKQIAQIKNCNWDNIRDVVKERWLAYRTQT